MNGPENWGRELVSRQLQRHLLETLELVELADDNAIEKQISPR